jgi:hypothetical protein
MNGRRFISPDRLDVHDGRRTSIVCVCVCVCVRQRKVKQGIHYVLAVEHSAIQFIVIFWGGWVCIWTEDLPGEGLEELGMRPRWEGEIGREREREKAMYISYTAPTQSTPLLYRNCS